MVSKKGAKVEKIIKDLESSPNLASKPKKMIRRDAFVKLANEVKRIFDEEKREKLLDKIF